MSHSMPETQKEIWRAAAKELLRRRGLDQGQEAPLLPTEFNAPETKPNKQSSSGEPPLMPIIED